MTTTVQFTTLCEAFQHTAALRPDAVALRTLGGAQELTWREYADRVRRVAGGLDSLGLRRGDTMALLLTNRPEFNLVDTAALHLGLVPFSIYQTSAPAQIAYLLRHSRCRVVVTERQFLDQVRAAGVPVEHLVVVDGPVEGTASLGLDDLENTEADGFDFDATWRSVEGSDVLTLIYTSGTTGDPKGVELTHANVLAGIMAVDDELGVHAEDRTISYLPSAHIADRVSAHYIQIAHGIEVTSITDARRVAEALVDARPTFWFAVPRVWQKIKLALESRLAAAPAEQAAAISRAFEVALARVRAQQAGLDVEPEVEAEFQALDQAVLAPMRAAIGFDRMRWAMSGAAAIAPKTLEFFMALGLTIVEVWGMSETTGAATYNPPSKVKIGTVGVAVPGVDLRVDEDGELLVRGPILMSGYRDDPARTAETFTEDGWLRTGDVVTIDDEGYVTIVDRKKELIINSGGKNMSPTAIENTVKVACPLVGEIVVIGDDRSYNTALVALEPDVSAAVAAKAGIADASPAALSRHPVVVEAIRAGIAEANAKLSRIEQVKRFRVLPTIWEPGGDEITPTMKLKRRNIGRKYAADVEVLYQESLAEGVHEPSERTG
ncbi:AMP-dependent synthetase/ligase [Umezawaea endophytica]|uniref:Acyl-CoA synthetase n=1 Tax=Umezawaea endophytica TaxID=1654476 RepID=A0A9X2VF60_9PSEU|nr:AMP-dependent synthetase/ligase [Umezawaea endophytica]MCS7475332.1 AMP-dependent synthetase/ligase [Umezawaea endophytica]